jgi:hypothetical protein
VLGAENGLMRMWEPAHVKCWHDHATLTKICPSALARICRPAYPALTGGWLGRLPPTLNEERPLEGPGVTAGAEPIG